MTEKWDGWRNLWFSVLLENGFPGGLGEGEGSETADQQETGRQEDGDCRVEADEDTKDIGSEDGSYSGK